jgi:hypothetical protein
MAGLRGIRQSTINVLALAVLGAALFLLVGGSYIVRVSANDAKQAQDQEKEMLLLAETMNTVSDYLTDQVRSFVISEDRANMDAYWKEAEIDRRRELVIAKAIAKGIPSEELRHLAEAKAASDGLMRTEARAMRLMCEALGYGRSAMPAEIAQYKLGEGESALSAESKQENARELVFSAHYWASKKLIRKDIDDFRVLATVRVSKETRSAQLKADRAFVFVTLICLLSFACECFIVLLYFRLTALPVVHYTKTLVTKDKAVRRK